MKWLYAATMLESPVEVPNIPSYVVDAAEHNNIGRKRIVVRGVPHMGRCREFKGTVSPEV